MDVLISCQGGDYTAEIHPKLRKRGLDRLLDRRRLHAADGRRRGHRSRPGQPRRHRHGARSRHQELHRRQLHRQPDAHGMAGLFRAGLVEWMTVDDLSGRVGRRRPAHARAGGADGRDARSRSPPSLADPLVDPRHRSRGVADACAAPTSPPRSSASRSPAACCPGSTRTLATVRAGRSGKRRPKATRSSAGRRSRSRWTASASASARCAATARRSR